MPLRCERPSRSSTAVVRCDILSVETGRCGKLIRDSGLDSWPEACGVIACESNPPSDPEPAPDLELFEYSVAEVPAGVNGGEANSGARELNRGD